MYYPTHMPILGNQLALEKCPHCNVDKPSLIQKWNVVTRTYSGKNQRNWAVYVCSRCGGLVTAGSNQPNLEMSEIYPETNSVSDAIPSKAKRYLKQAFNSLHVPSGAVMLAASAVDAMLKEKGYTTGKLYSRINKAAKDHLITKGMAKWAHQVRLDANDQRHADEDSDLPIEQDAIRAVEFAKALAEFLFVLPSRVTRGLEDTQEEEKVSEKEEKEEATVS